MDTKLGIIILNYNSWKVTKECIDSIFLNKISIPFEIFVIDNLSRKKPGQDFMNFISKQDNVHLFFNKSNDGYSAGNNVGIKQAINSCCTHFLISNPDIVYKEKSIMALVDSLSEENTGIVGPLCYSPGGKLLPIWMGLKMTALNRIKGFLSQTKFKFLVKKYMEKFVTYTEPNEKLKRFCVSGCCFMFDNRALKYIYPLDEHVFLFHEEYIIGSKLEKTNLRTFVIPEAKVIHLEGESVCVTSKFSQKCFLESEQYYLKKYAKSPFFLRKIVYICRMLIFKFQNKGK